MAGTHVVEIKTGNGKIKGSIRFSIDPQGGQWEFSGDWSNEGTMPLQIGWWDFKGMWDLTYSDSSTLAVRLYELTENPNRSRRPVEGADGVYAIYVCRLEAYSVNNVEVGSTGKALLVKSIPHTSTMDATWRVLQLR
jgi:hypothetical protein